MLRTDRKLIFAIEAVLDIAYNARGEPVQSADITERQGIPKRYLEQVLQTLVRGKILSGTRGPRGGYLLARERRRITVGDIVRTVRANETAACDDYEHEGSMLGEQVVWPMWRTMTQICFDHLDGITIEELCERAQNSGIERVMSGDEDFTI